MGLFDLVDVGLCRWWDCFVGLFDLVDVWCWMWVCLVWWMVCTDLSGCFFFFFEVCGSGCWWPLLPHGGWAGVGDEEDDDSDRDREEEIYYFIM